MRGWQQASTMNLEENGARYGGELFFGLQLQRMTMRNNNNNNNNNNKAFSPKQVGVG